MEEDLNEGLDVKACRLTGMIVGILMANSAANALAAAVTKTGSTAVLAAKAISVAPAIGGVAATVSGAGGAVAGAGSAAQAVAGVVTVLTAASTSPALLPAAGLFGLVTLIGAGACYVKSKMTREDREGAPENSHDQNVRASDASLQASANSNAAFFPSNPVRESLAVSSVMTRRLIT